MTAPAADCGVPAGCGACPLGRAGVCGDPGTPAPGSSYFRMFDAPAHDPDPEPDLRTAEEWEIATGVWVLNPDGWADLPLSTPITREEFRRRAALSTVYNDGHGDGSTDLDPAEPRPADAGCCGGACSA